MPQRQEVSPSMHRFRMERMRRAYGIFTRTVHKTALSVLAHDCLSMAQSCAYSAIVALFPTLMVAAAVIDLLPDTAPLRFQLAIFFDRILPSDVRPVLESYFENSHRNAHSVRALTVAAIVSVIGASNVIASLMEGFRRAYGLPRNCWHLWERQGRAYALVPLSLVPLLIASMLVVFGHAVTMRLAYAVGPVLRQPVYIVALLVRWTVALSASVGLIALIFHLGTPSGFAGTPSADGADEERVWSSVLPGAVLATAMWFLTTLAFGLYVTRFANYSEVYGSLGAGIALLFWLYLISLSVLCGAEFNANLRYQTGRGREFGEPKREPASDAAAAPPARDATGG
jgi:membrane protein